jgi:hypothetical protein
MRQLVTSLILVWCIGWGYALSWAIPQGTLTKHDDSMNARTIARTDVYDNHRNAPHEEVYINYNSLDKDHVGSRELLNKHLYNEHLNGTGRFAMEFDVPQDPGERVKQDLKQDFEALSFKDQIDVLADVATLGRWKKDYTESFGFWETRVLRTCLQKFNAREKCIYNGSYCETPRKAPFFSKDILEDWSELSTRQQFELLEVEYYDLSIKGRNSPSGQNLYHYLRHLRSELALEAFGNTIRSAELKGETQAEANARAFYNMKKGMGQPASYEEELRREQQLDLQ